MIYLRPINGNVINAQPLLGTTAEVEDDGREIVARYNEHIVVIRYS